MSVKEKKIAYSKGSVARIIKAPTPPIKQEEILKETVPQESMMPLKKEKNPPADGEKKDSLKDQKCTTCQGGSPRLKGAEIEPLASQLGAGWKVIAEHHLEKDFFFKNFLDGLAFVNRLGILAETEGHHPDIHLSWGKVKVVIYTHKAGGLTESDFILAAKCDTLLN